MAKFAVIIPAAGKGERFGGGEKKTFAKLDGRPIFLRTIEHFTGRADVCQIILAVAPEDVEQMKTSYGANLGFMGIKLVEGGPRRCDTVAAALKAVVPDAEYIAIHDAARPCVTAGMIDAVFAEAQKSGAAILAVPLCGTLKQVGKSAVVERTVSREGLYEAQTPQVFRKDVLAKAYEDMPSGSDDVTDDSQWVERTGHPVAIVQSDSTNIKITTKPDIALANAILKARPAKLVSRMGAFEEAKW